MASLRTQVLGVTRWSYPSNSADFRKSGKDLDQLREQLYAPHRLEHRLFLLEHVVLPCLRAQTDPNFRQLFVMGDQLPDPWRKRLLGLLKTVPQAMPVFMPEGQDMRAMLSDMIPTYRDKTCDVFAQYRIDDDDAVGAEFVAKSREIFDQLRPIYETEGIAGLDYTRGLIMATTQGNIDFRPVAARQWAPGLVVFQEASTAKSVFEFPHLRVWHSMPVLTHRQTAMFIRGAHHDNDSQIGTFARRTKSFAFNPPNLKRFLRRKFGMDLPALKAAWAEGASRFSSPGTDEAHQELQAARNAA